MQKLAYPDYEVIVVDDGSNDHTREVIDSFPVRRVTIPNGGLGNARNVGLAAAKGEIVAYIDDDAYPDPHWLHYLVHTFLTTDFVGVGGPNLPPPDDGPIAECVANAPGGPNHALLSDRVAEHVAGCNMAFRRNALQEIGGFDPQFRIAGDEVDLCWRLQESGGELGFASAAVVWHHRRGSIDAYLRQQRTYGAAEAMLEAKWPQKFNGPGPVSWSGRLHGRGPTLPLLLQPCRVDHGVRGSCPFQPMYEPRPGLLRSLPLLPEWFFVTATLAALALVGLLWPPLLIAGPLLVLALVATLMQAAQTALHAPLRRRPIRERLRQRAIIAWLHLTQPLVRLYGRLAYGLTAWRRRGAPRTAMIPRPRTCRLWSEGWSAAEQWLERLEQSVRDRGGVTARGGPYDRWDLEVRGGLLGAVRVRFAIEDHGKGRQRLLFRSWPHVRPLALVPITALAVVAAMAIVGDSGWVALLLAPFVLALAAWTVRDCATAAAGFLDSRSELVE
ncbi:MAG: glycosyltransferase family 2 protein [Planctomycetota bacterium]